MQNCLPPVTTLPHDINVGPKDVVALGLDGVYEIEKIQFKKLYGRNEKYFVLEKLFTISNMKLFVPINRCQKQGLRKIISKEEFKSAIKTIKRNNESNLQLLSPKKIIEICTKKIKNDGFSGLLNCFILLRSYSDIFSTKDKNIAHFLKGTETAITEEIAVVNHLDLNSSKEKLSFITEKCLF